MLTSVAQAVALARARVARTERLPRRYRKWVATKLCTRFAEAASLVEAELALPGPLEVLCKMRYAAVNASDVLKTNGYYGDLAPPFDLGLEGVGEVVAVGPLVPGSLLGKVLAISDTGATAGCFGEYRTIHLLKSYAMPVPRVAPGYAAMMVTGVSMQVALAECAKIKRGETLLVTAAAGSAGSYAVQLGKLAGCHVVGTCGGASKAALLLRLGCDRAIDYQAESVSEVLAREYAQGVNVVIDSVGGELFDTCVDHLAERGRLVVFGYVADYEASTAERRTRPVYDRLLAKSAELRGFAFKHFKARAAYHGYRLSRLIHGGKVEPVVDPTPFIGIESVARAVAHQRAGKNLGKVVVAL